MMIKTLFIKKKTKTKQCFFLFFVGGGGGGLIKSNALWSILPNGECSYILFSVENSGKILGHWILEL